MTDMKDEILKEKQAEDAEASEPMDETAAEENAEAETSEEAGQAGADEAGETAVEEKEEEKEDESTRYLRLMADFQNYKKRVEKEKRDLYAYANEKIVVELLEVLDNFERALGQEAGDGFAEGMEMIFKQMSNVLEKAGMAEIEALGQEFDPNVHSAVMTEDTDEYESGKVSGVFQKGYTLNGKVIRPSMVKVAN